jgi:hypothetical protein
MARTDDPFPIAIDRKQGEKKRDHAQRLIGYGEDAMKTFRAATGEISNPNDLIRCLLLWSVENGFGPHASPHSGPIISD